MILSNACMTLAASHACKTEALKQANKKPEGLLRNNEYYKQLFLLCGDALCPKAAVRFKVESIMPPTGVRRLSNACRYSAFQHNCAVNAAKAAFKKPPLEQRAAFEAELISRCGPKVCPGDPFMIHDPGAVATSQGSKVGQQDGGVDITGEELLSIQEQGLKRAELAEGVSAGKMRNYVIGGLVVMVILVMATSKGKTP